MTSIRRLERRDTAANWTANNPVLGAGEIGVELPATAGTLGKVKVGDGTTAWVALPYLVDAAQSALYVYATGGGKEAVATIDPANSAATINLALANVFHVYNPVAGGTCTLTLAGATAGKSCGCTIYFHQRATGNSLVAFAGGAFIGMNDGALTAPAQTAGGVAAYSLVTTDGGATWYAWKVGEGVVPTAPPAPTIGTATAGNAQATVTHTLNGTGGSAITSTTITPYIGATAGTPQVFNDALLTHVVTGLTNGTAYTFKVKVTNAVGTSPDSAASNSATPTAPTVPGAPTIGTATGGNTSAVVTWTAPASNGGSAITGYTVTPYIGATAQAATTVGNVLTTTITGLTNGTAYTFKVAAVNAVGTGAQSANSNTVTPAFTPAAYSNLTHWVEGDAVGGSPVDGGTLGSWGDLSTSAKAYAQATASKKPQWVASAAGFNGKSVVRFNAASQQQMDTASPVSTLLDGFTHIVVCSTSDVANEDCVFYNGDRASNGRGLYPCSGITPTSGKISILQGGTAWQDSTTAPPSVAAIYMFKRTGGTMVLYLNGVPLTIASPTAGSGVALTGATSVGGDGTYYHDGDVALELTYDAVRSTADLNALGAAYAAKYGFTWTPIV